MQSARKKLCISDAGRTPAPGCRVRRLISWRSTPAAPPMRGARLKLNCATSRAMLASCRIRASDCPMHCRGACAAENPLNRMAQSLRSLYAAGKMCRDQEIAFQLQGPVAPGESIAGQRPRRYDKHSMICGALQRRDLPALKGRNRLAAPCASSAPLCSSSAAPPAALSLVDASSACGTAQRS